MSLSAVIALAVPVIILSVKGFFWAERVADVLDDRNIHALIYAILVFATFAIPVAIGIFVGAVLAVLVS